jgi:dTDP-4-amino-4,6-dideoxygalactose transaminase
VRKVPLFDLHPIHQPLQPEFDAAFRRVSQSGQFINGPEIGEFECAIAGYLGIKNAVACASGSDAIALALLALGIGPGDKVVVPAFTFFATAGYVQRVGAIPVFADIEPASFQIDTNHLRQLLEKDRAIKAIMPVHLFGATADLDPILDLAQRHGLYVVEDGAQSIGASYKQTKAQTIGHLGCLSFFPTKNLGACGDAGMVTTNDDSLAEKVRIFRSHGSKIKYFHQHVGMNSRLDTLQAALLLVKLPHLDRWTQLRTETASHYQQSLADLPEIQLPRTLPFQTQHVWNQFTIRAHRRDQLKAFLAQQGVGTEIYYPLSLHLQECFQGLGYRSGDFPESERATEEVLSLPIYPGLSADDREYVADSIRRFYR